MTDNDLRLINKALHLNRLAEAAGYGSTYLSKILSGQHKLSARMAKRLGRALAQYSLGLVSEAGTALWTVEDLRRAKHLFNLEAIARMLGCSRQVCMTDYLGTTGAEPEEDKRRELTEVLAQCGLAIIATDALAVEDADVEEIIDVAERLAGRGDMTTSDEVVRRINEELYQVGAASVMGPAVRRSRYAKVAALCLHAMRNRL